MWARTEASRRFRVSGDCPESCTVAARRSRSVGTRRELHWPTRRSRGLNLDMHSNSLTSATRSVDTAVWRWVFESGSLFHGEVSPPNFFRAEKGAVDKTFQTRLSEANLELATLLREV